MSLHLRVQNGRANAVDLDPEVITANDNIAFFALTLLVEVEHQDLLGAVFVVKTARNTRVGIVDELA